MVKICQFSLTAKIFWPFYGNRLTPLKTSLKGHFLTVARSFRCLEKQNNIFKGHYSGVK